MKTVATGASAGCRKERVIVMHEECLICHAPLEYLPSDVPMECALCGRKELSKTRCIHGHYVCNDCHTSGMDAVIGLCLKETSGNPIRSISRFLKT